MVIADRYAQKRRTVLRAGSSVGNMDARVELLKKKRRSLRTALTKALNSLNILLDDPITEIADLTVAYGLLNAKQQELETLESELIDALQEGTASDQEITKEYDGSDVYKSKYLLAKYKFDSRIAARNRAQSARASPSPSVIIGDRGGDASHEGRNNYPKIELYKFSANVRDWLKFWSLFKKIYEETKLDNEDKFQYLMQAMVPDSRAAELVNCYPPTGDNYVKAIESLKQRFGSAEVQSEQRIAMAAQGFKLDDSSESDRSQKKRAQSTAKYVPSARNLLTKGKEITCIFCEKNDHDSAKCEKAKSMSSDERQESIKKHRTCFRCLKIGHASRLCCVNVKCSKCSRRHVDIMCFGEQKREDSTKKEKCVSAVNMQEECNLASSSEMPTTFMQTLKVKIRSDSQEIVVPAVIDTGSQNSYVLREVSDLLNYEPIAKLDMVHLLFGGEKSEITSHNKYLILVGNMDGSYWCNFKALDEKVICSDVPTVTKVNLTDVCRQEKTVAILIGADVAGKLLTGCVHVLESGLTCRVL
ncbi:hypothetical protein TSAR_004834 [Trichomalopsis sarcophagae]|uniref:CCHC-type domain-containing protein n=1 Tax=Trichomalopsis sarcophagae TaxID=543379 RepID=A0A232EPR9_9HYME|nr:hypothetical protein TSAR_004834 [Trichomalopsis sarcophagae]